ncbi:MAG: chalcone isomerase family protein [Myxococcaceae bacterium]
MKTQLLATLLLAGLAGAGAAQAKNSKPLMAEAINIDGKPLVLNGAATQSVLCFDLYRVGLYLEQPTRNGDEAIASDQLKHLRLQVLRKLSREKVATALRSGLERGVGRLEAERLRPRFNEVISRLSDVSKRDELLLTYVPGEGTTIADSRQTLAKIPGKDFADAFFSIWLSRTTDAPRVRTKLLGG